MLDVLRFIQEIQTKDQTDNIIMAEGEDEPKTIFICSCKKRFCSFLNSSIFPRLFSCMVFYGLCF